MARMNKEKKNPVATATDRPLSDRLNAIGKEKNLCSKVVICLSSTQIEG